VKVQHRCHHEGCPDSGGYVSNVTASAVSMKTTFVALGVNARHVHPSPSTRPTFFCGRHRPRVKTGGHILAARTAAIRGIIRP
jgi:hypothetical protein